MSEKIKLPKNDGVNYLEIEDFYNHLKDFGFFPKKVDFLKIAVELTDDNEINSYVKIDGQDLIIDSFIFKITFRVNNLDDYYYSIKLIDTSHEIRIYPNKKVYHYVENYINRQVMCKCELNDKLFMKYKIQDYFSKLIGYYIFDKRSEQRDKAKDYIKDYIDKEKVCKDCPKIKFYAGEKEDGRLITPDTYDCDAAYDIFDANCQYQHEIDEMTESIRTCISLIENISKTNIHQYKTFFTTHYFNMIKSGILELKPNPEIEEIILDLLDTFYPNNDILPFHVYDVQNLVDDAVEVVNVFEKNPFDNTNDKEIVVKFLNERNLIYNWIEIYRLIYTEVQKFIEKIEEMDWSL